MKAIYDSGIAVRRIMRCLICSLLVSFPLKIYASGKTGATPLCPSRGLDIPAKEPYKRIGGVPGWDEGGGVLKYLKDGSFWGLAYLSKGQTTCMALDYARPDRSRVLKDVIDISHVYRNPGPPWAEEGFCYQLKPGGRIERDGDRIIGISLPEKGRAGCTHYSRRIRSAWRIDIEAGRFVPVPTQNLICDRPVSGDGCYDCKRYKDGLHCE